MIDRFVTVDPLVHTWDLARAFGADARLDEDAVRRASHSIRPMDAMIRRPNLFGPGLDPPDGQPGRRHRTRRWGRSMAPVKTSPNGRNPAPR